MSFLWKKSPRGIFMDVVFSALQNGVRRGDTACVVAMLGELDGYPGAMRTRLVACAFDVPSPSVLFGLRRFKGVEGERAAIKDAFLELCAAKKSHDATWLDRLLVEALLATDGQAKDAAAWERVHRDWPEQAAVVLKYLPRYRLLLRKEVAKAFAGWDPRWLELSRCCDDNPLAFCCATLSQEWPDIYAQGPLTAAPPPYPTAAAVAVPAYAYDKHTREGRKLGRDFGHFVRESLQFNHRLLDVDYFQAPAIFVQTEGVRTYGGEEQGSARALRARYVPPAVPAAATAASGSLAGWLLSGKRPASDSHDSNDSNDSKDSNDGVTRAAKFARTD